MSIFIKAGLWAEKRLGYKGEFDLTNYVQSLIPTPPDPIPYKSYFAIITQAGTNPPTVNKLLYNNLGATVTFEYVSVGTYNVKITGNLFTANKTAGILSTGTRTAAGQYSASDYGVTIVDTQTIKINSFNANGSQFTDGVIRQMPLEIRVYN